MNIPPPDVRAEAQRWLGEADEELSVATVLAEHGELPARAACFHAHLAVEKALKAVIVRRGIVLPRSHDLLRLVQLLAREDQDRFDLDDLTEINPWTVEGRYPADLADVGLEELRGLLARAARAVATSRQLIR